ncbi:uncharacterized protein LOC144869476 [Branchiostoma floridae x Branchiostoma japonicum]
MERGFVCRVAGLLRGGEDSEGRPALNVVTGVIKGTYKREANEEEPNTRLARTKATQHLKKTISQRPCHSEDTTKELTQKPNTNPEEDNCHLESTLEAIKDHLQPRLDNGDSNPLESVKNTSTCHQSKDQDFKSMQCKIQENIVTCYGRGNQTERRGFRVPETLEVASVTKADFSPDPNRVISIVSVPVDTEKPKNQDTHSSCSHSDQQTDQSNMNHMHETMADYYRPNQNDTIQNNGMHHPDLQNNPNAVSGNFNPQPVKIEPGRYTPACRFTGQVGQDIPRIAPYSSPEIHNELVVVTPPTSHIHIEQNGVGGYENSQGLVQHYSPHHLISAEHRSPSNHLSKQLPCPNSYTPWESLYTENVHQTPRHFGLKQPRSPVPHHSEGAFPSTIRRYSTNLARRSSLTSSGLGSSSLSDISRMGSSSSIASYASEDSAFYSPTIRGSGRFDLPTANVAMRQDTAWHVTANGTCSSERVAGGEMVDQHGRYPSWNAWTAKGRTQGTSIVPLYYNRNGHYCHYHNGLAALQMNTTHSAAVPNPLNHFQQQRPVASNQEVPFVHGYGHSQERPTAAYGDHTGATINQASSTLTGLAERVNAFTPTEAEANQPPVVQQLPVISEVFTCNFGGTAVMESEQQPNIVSPYIVHFDGAGNAKGTEAPTAENNGTFQSVNASMPFKPPPSYQEALNNIIRQSTISGGDQIGPKDVIPSSQSPLQVQTPQDAQNARHQLYSSSLDKGAAHNKKFTYVRRQRRKPGINLQKSRRRSKEMNSLQKRTRNKSKAPETQLEEEQEEPANTADSTPKDSPNQVHLTQDVGSEASQTQQPKQLQEPPITPDDTSEQTQDIGCQLQSTQVAAPEVPEALKTQQPDQGQTNVTDITQEQVQKARCHELESTQATPDVTHAQQQLDPQERVTIPDSTHHQAQNTTRPPHPIQREATELSQTKQLNQPKVYLTVPDSIAERAQQFWQRSTRQQVALEAQQTQQQKQLKEPPVIPDTTPNQISNNRCQLHSTQQVTPEILQTQQPKQAQDFTTIPDSTSQAQSVSSQVYTKQQVAPEIPQTQQPKEPQALIIPQRTPKQTQNIWCQLHSTPLEASQTRQPKQPQVHVFIPDSVPKEVQHIWCRPHSEQTEASLTRQPNQQHTIASDSIPKQASNALYQLPLTQQVVESSGPPRPQPQGPPVIMPSAMQDENVQLLQQNQKTLQELKKAVASLEATIQQLQGQQQNPAQQELCCSTTQREPQAPSPAAQSAREPSTQRSLPLAVEDIQTRLEELTRSMTGIQSNITSKSLVQMTHNDPSCHRSPAPPTSCEKQVDFANLVEPCMRTSSPKPATTTLHYPAQTASNLIHKRTASEQTATKEMHCPTRQSGSGQENRSTQQSTINSGLSNSNTSREVPYPIPSILPCTEYGEHLHIQDAGQGIVEDTLSGRPAENNREGGNGSNDVWISQIDQIVPNVEICHSLPSTPEIEDQRSQRKDATWSKSQEEGEGQNNNKESEKQQPCSLYYQRRLLEIFDGQHQSHNQEAGMYDSQENVQLVEEGHNGSIVTQQLNKTDLCPQDQESDQTHTGHGQMQKEAEIECQTELESQQENCQQTADNHEYQEQVRLPEVSLEGLTATPQDHVDQYQQELFQEDVTEEAETQYQNNSLEEYHSDHRDADNSVYQLPAEKHDDHTRIQQSGNVEQSREQSETQTRGVHIKHEGETQFQKQSSEDLQDQQQDNQRQADNHKQHLQPNEDHDGSMVTQHLDYVDQCQQEPLPEHPGQEHLKNERGIEHRNKSLEEIENHKHGNQEETDIQQCHEQLQLQESDNSKTSIQHSGHMERPLQEPCQTQTVSDHLKINGATQCKKKLLEELEGQQQDSQQGREETDEFQEQVQMAQECQESTMVAQLPDQGLLEPCQTQTGEEHRNEGKTDGQQEDQYHDEEEPRRKRKRPNEDQSKCDPEEISASIRLRRFVTMEKQKRASEANHQKGVLKTTKWSIINKPWTTLSKAQHDRLEEVFQVWRNRRVEKTLIFQLSEELNLSERQVKMWFYHRKERDAKSKELLAKKAPDVFRCSTSLFDTGCPLDPMAALKTNPRQLSVEDCALVVQHLQSQLNKIINPE